MENSDAEYKALTTVIKNDKRQRFFVAALVFVAFLTLLAFLQYINNTIGQRIQAVIDQQTQLVIDSQKDGRTRSEESRRYITCLLILPQSQRDVSTQRYCFDKSDLPGGRANGEFVPIELDVSDAAIAMLQAEPVDQSRSESSFPQSAPVAGVPQSDTSQPSSDNSVIDEEEPTPEPAPTNRITIPVVTPLLNFLGFRT